MECLICFGKFHLIYVIFHDFLLSVTWCCPPSHDQLGLKVKILQAGLVKPPEALSLQGARYLHFEGASPLYSVLWSFKILTTLEAIA